MRKQISIVGIICASLMFCNFSIKAQTTSTPNEIIEVLPYGDMDTWMVRYVKESWSIGSNERIFYEIAKGDTLFDEPYKNVDSPWAVSSVLAKVSGITKVSSTVFPEKRGNGYAARLETKIETVKVLGLININVLASGTIFLGQMIEPITGTNDPMKKMIAGVPFTRRPKALQYDYKVHTGGNSIQSTGFSKQKKLDQKDMAEVNLCLQHRWEDADGNIFAKRVATAWENFDKSQTEWQNKHRLSIHYGDITSESFYIDAMRLRKGDEAHYTQNSKGDMVPIQEVGWATDNESVTHIMLQFSSSNGGAYIGSTDSRFWVDNISLVY